MVGGAGTGEELRKIRWTKGRETLEDSLHKMELSSGRQSGKTKFSTSSRSRGVFTSTKNSATSKVQQGFKAKGLKFSTPEPNNIAVVKVGKNVRLEEKKQKGPRKKPRETTKQVQTARDLLTYHVNVIDPS